MVIVEVKRDWDGFDRLLGEHKWADFLRNPSKEEDKKITQVFYCRWNSGECAYIHPFHQLTYLFP